MSDADIYTQAMFGSHARHVPVWMWVQGDSDAVIIAGGSRGNGHAHPLRYGSDATHQFILGELIVRPHLVFETDHYRGSGVSGLLTSGTDIEEIVRHGNLIADPIGRFGVKS